MLAKSPASNENRAFVKIAINLGLATDYGQARGPVPTMDGRRTN